MDELNKVLVIALIENETNRYKAEHQIVKYLDGKGVVSHDYFDTASNEKNEEAIMAKIKNDGFDGSGYNSISIVFNLDNKFKLDSDFNYVLCNNFNFYILEF